MTASRLDDLSVNDFDDAADYTVDIRSGSVHVARAAESANAPAAEASGPVAMLVEKGRVFHPSHGACDESGPRGVCSECYQLDMADASYHHDASARLAHGTEPLQPAIDPHLQCAVSLHEALSTLLALEALVTRCGGYLPAPDQDTLFAARRLLERHGRR